MTLCTIYSSCVENDFHYSIAFNHICATIIIFVSDTVTEKQTTAEERQQIRARAW
jgi:hypothetical protein